MELVEHGRTVAGVHVCDKRVTGSFNGTVGESYKESGEQQGPEATGGNGHYQPYQVGDKGHNH